MEASSQSPELPARRILSQLPQPCGKCLVLGAADTGKTSLILALANMLVRSGPVAVLDTANIPSKSPSARLEHRRKMFEDYFRSHRRSS